MYRQEEGQAVRVSEAGTGRGAGVPRLGNNNGGHRPRVDWLTTRSKMLDKETAIDLAKKRKTKSSET